MRSEELPGLADADCVVFGNMAEIAKPVIPRKVSVWAEEARYVAGESGSSRRGKWKNATQPLAIEVMDCLSADDPSPDVVVKASAQLFKTEVGINWCGYTIEDDPCSMMVVLPTIAQVSKFNATKFEPNINATPTLRAKVQEQLERSKTGSTVVLKKFRDGFINLVAAQSSSDLQSVSAKRGWGDEVSEFAMDAGGRGDPVKQIKTRADAHDDAKFYWSSTPKDAPNCRITNMYEAGDQRQPYAECPHCHEMQLLLFENMVPPTKKGGRVTFQCVECGVLIDEIHKPAMLRDGHIWIKTYPSEDPLNPAPPVNFPLADLPKWRSRPSEGRIPSFYAWQAYSLLKSWTKIWAEYQDALHDVQTGKDPEAMKVFTQQKLGMAWEGANDAPDSQKLFEQRGKYVKRGLIPGWACEIILTADVQGDRIEWDVFAYGPDLSCARFDWGVVEHDPLEAEAWAQLALVIGRRWPGEKTIDLGADIVGVDLGGKKGVTERVYRFVRGRHNVHALKGSSDHEAVPLTRGKRRRIQLDDGSGITVEPWLVGGWALKTNIYSMLEVSREAKDARLPGGLYNPADATLEDFKQYTAEVFKQPKSKRSGAHGWWERIPGQANERLDLAVYARALAWKRGVFTRTAAEWHALMQSRLRTPETDMPLFETTPAPPPEPITAPNPGNTSLNWFANRKSA